MKHQSILISLLVSPKSQLDFQKRSKFEFLKFVGELRAKKRIDVPIEVYPVTNGKYYIADGVHRAKAAQLAGFESIDVIIYNDSRPAGLMVPLESVVVP